MVLSLRFPSVIGRLSSRLVEICPRLLSNRAPKSMTMYGTGNVGLVQEGSVIVEVPSSKVYYNKYDSMARDLKVLLVESFSRFPENVDKNSLKILYACAQTGVGGLRYAKELTRPPEVVLCNRSEIAAECARNNAQRNGCHSVRIEDKDCRAVLTMHRQPQFNFDVIDLGLIKHPLAYVPHTFQAVRDGGLLMMEASFSAEIPLYFAGGQIDVKSVVRNNDLFRENKVRTYLGVLQRCAVYAGCVIEPLLGLALRHCGLFILRVHKLPQRKWHFHDYVRVKMYCGTCWHEDFVPLSVVGEGGKRTPSPLTSALCPLCETPLHFCGQAWAESFIDKDFAVLASSVLETADISRHFSSEEMLRILFYILRHEVTHGTTIDCKAIASKFMSRPLPTELFANELKICGYEAGLTHVGKNLVRTTAPYECILDICYHFIKQVGQVDTKSPLARRLLARTPQVKNVDFLFLHEKTRLFRNIGILHNYKYDNSTY